MQLLFLKTKFLSSHFYKYKRKKTPHSVTESARGPLGPGSPGGSGGDRFSGVLSEAVLGAFTREETRKHEPKTKVKHLKRAEMLRNPSAARVQSIGRGAEQQRTADI